jgi:hypothetical protein
VRIYLTISSASTIVNAVIVMWDISVLLIMKYNQPDICSGPLFKG